MNIQACECAFRGEYVCTGKDMGKIVQMCLCTQGLGDQQSVLEGKRHSVHVSVHVKLDFNECVYVCKRE